MTLLHLYEKNFISILFNLSMSFNFEILEKNMKIKTNVTRIANKFIFQLEIYKNHNLIKLCELSEIELKALSNRYEAFIFNLIKNVSTNIIFILKIYRYLSLSRWWTGRDLNPRPSGCEPNVHTKLNYQPGEKV
jgi:hypothetical protein